ncbi:MAG TPA: enoyl-CoA hydratase-related protein [Candidatus Micrarchaeia archaeon]|nr:enoyl-CoA hydratase-related protein [Candidatus Micrarchaeia archaeon]
MGVAQAAEEGPYVRRDEPADGVVRLTLDRPRQRNALSQGMGDALRQELAAIRQSGQARAVIVAAAGSAFCAGADLGALGAAGQSWDERRQALTAYYRAFLDLRELPIPSIAAVNGAAIGAGLNLALSCDLRVAGRSARFAASFVRVGIHPGGGCTWFLTQTVGPARTRELLLLGEVVEAEQAERMGLVNRLVDDQELGLAAVALAAAVAAGPAAVIRDIRQTVDLAQSHGLEAVLAFETGAQAASLMADDAREGWQAFLEKRPPVFGGR